MSVQEWQPIATAPLDEDTSFLGWDTHNGFYVARFDYLFAGEAGQVAKFSDHDWRRCQPTHWMPLPDAPVQS